MFLWTIRALSDCTLALYNTKKSHYAISMWQIPTPKIFFLPRSFTFSPEFRPERNKVRWSLFHIWRTSGRTASPTRTFQQNNPPSENKWWDAFLSFFLFLSFLRLASNKVRITNLKVSMCSNSHSLIWTIIFQWNFCNAIGFLTLVWSHIRYKKTCSTEFEKWRSWKWWIL